MRTIERIRTDVLECPYCSYQNPLTRMATVGVRRIAALAAALQLLPPTVPVVVCSLPRQSGRPGPRRVAKDAPGGRRSTASNLVMTRSFNPSGISGCSQLAGRARSRNGSPPSSAPETWRRLHQNPGGGSRAIYSSVMRLLIRREDVVLAGIFQCSRVG